MKFYDSAHNFLGIEEVEHYQYDSSKVVLQLLPYEHTSSYLEGSNKGPSALLQASHYVELYDEELQQETYSKLGIATQEVTDFGQNVDWDAVRLIEAQTNAHLTNKKFVMSFGAEHTVTLGLFRAFQKHYNDVSILQIDAHSDLRHSYEGNELSHACVMARIHETGARMSQVGIRAQCKEEAELIKNSEQIQTLYAHEIQGKSDYIESVLEHLSDTVYITVDADGFDPSIVPAVGTPEPGGLLYYDVLELLRQVCSTKRIVGFDIVECAPIEGQIQSEYLLSKLAYKILG
ncbi:MAG: agmatinase, partial [Bacteroidia bacterium]|nr:agmatinase [Bacteroidia bacterium]